MRFVDSHANAMLDDNENTAPLNRRRFGLLASIALASCAGLLSGCATDDATGYDNAAPTYNGTDDYQQQQNEEDEEFEQQRQSEDDQPQMEEENN